MTNDDTCWADPLNREERARLRRMLASACRKFWNASQGWAWIEMADLHLDVTERAAVTA